MNTSTEDKAKLFWLIWLKVASLAVVSFGVLVILFNQLSISNLLSREFEYFGFGVNPFQYLATAFGILFIGWGLHIYYMAGISYSKEKRNATYSLIVALLIWYFVCFSTAICFKSVTCIMIVSFILIQLLAPLLYLRATSKP